MVFLYYIKLVLFWFWYFM